MLGYFDQEKVYCNKHRGHSVFHLAHVSHLLDGRNAMETYKKATYRICCAYARSNKEYKTIPCISFFQSVLMVIAIIPIKNHYSICYMLHIKHHSDPRHLCPG